MERELLEEMHQRIDEYKKRGLFQERSVVLFGSNESSERIMEYLEEKGICVAGVVDNNEKKDGTTLKGIPVSLPDKFLYPKKEQAVILIASRYYPEMAAQLINMGYRKGTEILKAVEYSAHHETSVSEEEFKRRVEFVKEGEKIFQKFFGESADLEKVFLCPLGSLGDPYVGMSFIRQYMEKSCSGQIEDKKRVSSMFALVTVNKVCKKIAYLFGYEKQVFTVTKEEMSKLMQYAVFMDMLQGKIQVLHHHYPYTCRIGEIGNYKGIHFVDHYRHSMFGLGEGSRPEIPAAHRDDQASKEYVKRLFEENDLLENNTVILLPYAKTAATLSVSLWAHLAKRLKEKGYTVCTNSSGEDEPVIEGTKKLFFDLRYGLEVVEKAGTVIALRNGLCDVLSTAKARKIILYPDRIYGPDSFINFYSLNRIGLCDDAVEVVVGEEMDVTRVLENV